jgi:hypothetical protein
MKYFKVFSALLSAALVTTGGIGGFVLASQAKTNLNADYTSTHSLTIRAEMNCPSDTVARQCKDSDMHLHNEGYVYRQFHNGTSLATASTFTWQPNGGGILSAKGGSSDGTLMANEVLIDLWINGVTSIECGFSVSASTSSFTHTLDVYDDGGYPSAGTTAIEHENLPETTAVVNLTETTNNHVRISLKAIQATGGSDPIITVLGVVINFTC